MKKRLAITIILVLLASAGLVAAHLLTSSNGQDVKISETTLDGSFDAAKGVQVTTEVELYGDDPMAWETTAVFDQEIKTETEVYPKGFPDKAYHNIHIGALNASGMYLPNHDIETHQHDICYIPPSVIKKISNQGGPGETIEDTVNMADYVDEVPIDFSIDSYVRNQDHFSLELSINDENQQYLSDHLTVSVPSNYPVELKIKKDAADKVESIQYYTTKQVSKSASAYVDENAAYVAINGYKEDETGTFHPLLENEYCGILQIPINNARQVQAKQMECIYPIKEDIFIKDLTLSADGKNFLLLIVEDDTNYLQVIDRESLQLKQKLKLSYHEKSDNLSKVVVKDNFYLAMTWYGKYVIASYENGIYQYFNQGQFDLSKLSKDHDMISALDVDAAFDGQRFVIATLAIGLQSNTSPSYYMQVIDQDQLLYYGRFDSSLFHDLKSKDTDANIDVSFVH